MPIRIFKILLVAVILFSLLVGGVKAADSIYEDDFKTLTNSWKQVAGTWTTSNGTVHATGGRPALIFNEWNGKKYIFKSDFSADDTQISDYANAGFYIYYEDEDSYARIVFGDDNRLDKKDQLILVSKGVSFVNKKRHIDINGNKTFEFSPDDFREVKIVRLDEKIWIYYQGSLAYTAEFKDENLAGRVGYHVYASTGYFDNFYLRPITMENASGYFNELNLTTTDPTAHLGPYTLRLEDIQTGTALLSLSKFGRVVDRVAASEGVTTGMNYENGEEGVKFRVVSAFNGSGGGRVVLEDVVYAGGESLAPQVENLSLQSTYYQSEDMNVTFSIGNPGAIEYTGSPEVTVSTQGASVTKRPELDLGAGESQVFTVRLTAPKTAGAHTLSVTLKLDEHTTVTKSVDYTVRVLNPVVTMLSPDLREEDGIRGSVSLGSAFPGELVDWNTTARVEVFRVFENGKQRVYSGEVPVRGKTFDVAITYDEFYQGDAQYLVTVTVGGMKSNKFFNIIGSDGVYEPVKVEIPQTVVSNNLYPQLMLLLMGMVAALSVRNHFHPRSWTLPLDLTAVGCGSIIILAGVLLNQAEVVSRGMILGGAGVGLSMARRNDERLNTLLLRGTPIHDFAGLILIFLTSSYVILQNPEWNIPLLMGTLITYYTLINLHGERRR